MASEHLASVMVQAFIDAVDAGLDLVPVVSDSTSTAKIGPFAQRFPERLINVGIAEQSLVSVAAGLALGGKIAATCNAAPFLISRANEQIKVDVCYNQANVKMFGLNAGASYGPLASTHHSLDDISVMRGFGNVHIFAPADAAECRQIVDYALRYHGPVYIRLDGKALPDLHDANYKFTPGQVDILRQGADVSIVALGSVVHEAVDAANLLAEQGIQAQVINLSSIRPLQRDVLLSALSGTRAVISVEEHNINGGVGSLVAEVLAEAGLGIALVRLGIGDGEYAAAGAREPTRALHNIDAAGIVAAATRLR
ncbi:1-deoxy-D-xylulose-5-phosphate synthase [Pseudomonas sp. 22 E 5]|jgi:transketolase|uniref:Transketolase family protein n=2 Tax=Pseudomonas TaxID=286 RepID=A0A4Y9T7G6_PSEFL|nr:MULTISPECIES: transketolase C-terminal domain-containing protein [Pseudomonas]CRM92846.1 1-deoxy-D-xylulose-5-phosphate synthase [Pseudomonas sp. 22 E 5]MCX9152552.1 transketolase family protein [Pseudomonas sp. TB1-B1]QXH65375.1 transketolase family protein [Pseudomonas asgharzadehiana]TFW39493.1 transketolase family protein [Pseudomonas fluorescens]TKJ65330.1 transketolase [Pseudomonas sp. CFBP13506]